MEMFKMVNWFQKVLSDSEPISVVEIKKEFKRAKKMGCITGRMYSVFWKNFITNKRYKSWIYLLLNFTGLFRHKVLTVDVIICGSNPLLNLVSDSCFRLKGYSTCVIQTKQGMNAKDDWDFTMLSGIDGEVLQEDTHIYLEKNNRFRSIQDKSLHDYKTYVTQKNDSWILDSSKKSIFFKMMNIGKGCHVVVSDGKKNLEKYCDTYWGYSKLLPESPKMVLANYCCVTTVGAHLSFTRESDSILFSEESRFKKNGLQVGMASGEPFSSIEDAIIRIEKDIELFLTTHKKKPSNPS